MLKIKKILLPVDFPNTSLPVIHQAAALAHHFHAEIVMLHVVNKLSRSSGIPADASKLTGWDMLAEILKEAQKNRDDSLAAEHAAFYASVLDGAPVLVDAAAGRRALAAALAVAEAMAESRAKMVAGGLLDDIEPGGEFQHGGSGGI